MIIGRCDPHRGIQPGIDLSAVDTGCTVSRIHAEIRRTTNGFCIEDKGSMNGTFINGRRLKSGDVVVLKPDDLCQLGRIALRFTGEKFIQEASPAFDISVADIIATLDHVIACLKSKAR